MPCCSTWPVRYDITLALRLKTFDMNYTQAREKTVALGGGPRLSELNARRWLFWFYPPLFFAPELLIAFANPVLAMSIYALLLIVLMVQRAFFTRSDVERNLYFGLILLPLTRLTSLALPFTQLPVQYWHLVMVIPLMLCAGLLLYWFKGSRSQVQLGLGNVTLNMAVAMGGIALGIAAANVLHATPWASVQALLDLDSLAAWLPLSGALLMTAICEEVIYRAIIQSQAIAVYGRMGIPYTALLYAIMSVGSMTALGIGWLQFAFVFLVAVLLGCIVHWTRSIVGVSLAHALMNCTAMILFPLSQLQPDSLAQYSLTLMGIVGAFIAAVPLLLLVWHLDRKGASHT